MRNPLRRLLPKSDRHLLMARPASGAPPAHWVDGVRVQSLTDPADPLASALDGFGVANGFPAGWVADMLADGAAASVAVRDAAPDVPLAMGWATRRRFHVEEIGATLDPDGGVYLFGDFVAPQHRGRRLQLLLVLERLRTVHSDQGACTIIAPGNVASLHSYTHAGFLRTDQFTRHRWLGRTWARCRPLPGGASPAFELRSGSVLRYMQPKGMASGTP